MEDVLIGGFVTIVIAIVMFIVFINMTSNIKQIKLTLNELSQAIANKKVYYAEREEWKGNKEMAIEIYLNYLYEVYKGNIWIHPKEKTKKIESVSKRIRDLGGTLPEIDV